MTVTRLATRAARVAARLRADAGVGPADAICPFDLAIDLGISVRFAAVPSLEGMYAAVPGRPTILVSSERPMGRRRYTCAHELGHHVFGHGTRLDELTDDVAEDWTPEEFLAHRFAAGLLMPKLGVESAFARRGWSTSRPSQEQVLTVAHDLGVGYVTLIGHLERTLRSISSSTARLLRRVPLSRLRPQLAGFPINHDVLIVDHHWGRRPVDIEVGDVVLVPPAARLDGDCVTSQLAPRPHLVASAAGTGTLTLDSDRAPVHIRVSERAFAGLARYRHLKACPDGD